MIGGAVAEKIAEAAVEGDITRLLVDEEVRGVPFLFEYPGDDVPVDQLPGGEGILFVGVLGVFTYRWLEGHIVEGVMGADHQEHAFAMEIAVLLQVGVAVVGPPGARGDIQDQYLFSILGREVFGELGCRDAVLVRKDTAVDDRVPEAVYNNGVLRGYFIITLGIGIVVALFPEAIAQLVWFQDVLEMIVSPVKGGVTKAPNFPEDNFSGNKEDEKGAYCNEQALEQRLHVGGIILRLI